MNILDEICKAISDLTGEHVDAITPDLPLFEGDMALDSITAIQLVLQVEALFDIAVDDDDLDFHRLRNPAQFASYVMAKKPSGNMSRE